MKERKEVRWRDVQNLEMVVRESEVAIARNLKEFERNQRIRNGNNETNKWK